MKNILNLPGQICYLWNFW